MTAHEVLVTARNLLDREGWIQDYTWTREGRCTVGAVLTPHLTEGSIEALELFADLIGCPRDWMAIAHWNDDPDRTKEQVLAVFDTAIAATAPPPPDPQWTEIVEEVYA
jgi:hypothetical protein